MTAKESLLTFIYLIAPVSRILWDYYVIETCKKSIKYTLHNIVTVLTIIVQVLVMHYGAEVSWFDSAMMSIAIYTLLFDYGLNYLRDKPVLRYFGDFTDKANLSVIEKYVYAKVSWQIILLGKLVFLIIAILVYGSKG